MPASITVNKLSKYYGKAHVAAVDNLSFEVNSGEVYGFLGANGAGKSTTIRTILGFLKPSQGSATIMGLDSVKDSVQAKKHVGYLSGDVALYLKPTGSQLLDYLGQFNKSSNYRKVLEKRFAADLHKPIGELSKGNRQKIGIIQAVMHQPAVLILDEPTSGLDPLMQEAFYQTIEECKQQGTAILMSSHNLDEAERICDRIGIIKHGKLIKEQVISEDTVLGSLLYKIKFSEPKSLEHFKKLKELKLVSQASELSIIAKPLGSISDSLKALGQLDIKEFSTQKADLEGEFLEFYGDEQ